MLKNKLNDIVNLYMTMLDTQNINNSIYKIDTSMIRVSIAYNISISIENDERSALIKILEDLTLTKSYAFNIYQPILFYYDGGDFLARPFELIKLLIELFDFELSTLAIMYATEKTIYDENFNIYNYTRDYISNIVDFIIDGEY